MQERVHQSSSADILLRAQPEPGIEVLTLNRPAARNGLSLDLINTLRREIDAVSVDPSISAVILAANGPAFCAGHDLKELTAHRLDADGGRAFFSETMEACAAMMQAIVASPKPFIAAVEGMATAAGCQLVATCDLATAAASAQFCTPGVNIGLFCSTPMVALSRNISRKRSMEMLLLGDVIGAEEAANYGLINRVTANGQALAEAIVLARRIGTKPATVVALGKTAFYRQIEQSLKDAYADTACVMVDNLLHADAQEGISAFIEKRHPAWPSKPE